jgi:hypothetical protein
VVSVSLHFQQQQQPYILSRKVCLPCLKECEHNAQCFDKYSIGAGAWQYNTWCEQVTHIACHAITVLRCAFSAGYAQVAKKVFTRSLRTKNKYGSGSIRPPLAAEARIRSQVIPSEICGRQSGTRAGFTPIVSIFPSVSFHHWSIPLSTACSYRQTNKQNLGTFQNAMLFRIPASIGL